MVIIVVAFADRSNGNKSVVAGVDAPVIGPTPPEVRGAVDQPGGVQHHDVTERKEQERCDENALSPAVPRDKGGEEEVQQETEGEVESVLEHDDAVLLQVRDVDGAALDEDVRVLAHHQPANVGEAESALGVVRVPVGLRVLVVDAVVTSPFQNVVLHGDAVEAHEQDAHRQPRLVALVRPQPVRARRHAQPADEEKKGVTQPSRAERPGSREHATQRQQVQYQHLVHVPPHHRCRQAERASSFPLLQSLLQLGLQR